MALATRFVRLTWAFSALVVLAACNLATPPQGAVPQAPHIELDPTGSFATGYLIVGYQADQDPTAIAARLGAHIETHWEPLRAALLALPEGLDARKARSLLAGEGLRYVELRRMIHHDPVPATGLDAGGPTRLQREAAPSAQAVSDPEFGLQWMHRQMNTQAAWDAGYTGAGVRIGIHDSYVDHQHPDLVDNVLYPGYDAFNDSLITPTTPHDGGSDHGTSVAGTAAAAANGVAGRGVAYGASLVPIAINDPTTGALDTVAIVNGGIFAALGPDFQSVPTSGTDTDNAPGGLGYVHVLNMSWGSDAYSQLIKDLADFMLLHEIVLVTSAGNTPTQAMASPSWYPGLITVAATTPQDHRTTFSNRGLHIDVAAPGEAIWTTTTRSCIYTTPDGSSCTVGDTDYAYINGTSFSSPAVAGVAALVIDAMAPRDGDGTFTSVPTPAQVRHILTSTARQPNGDGYSEDLGHGIVDAGAATALAETLTPETATDGATLVVDVNLVGDPNTYLPAVGVSIVPLGHDGPTKYVQTSDGSLLLEGQALFVGVDAGDYAVVVSGPHGATTGAQPGTASQIVTLPEGDLRYITISLDVVAFEDPNEPNEALEAARPLDVGTSARGTFFNATTGADEDFFMVQVDAGSTYWFNLETVAGNFDASMQILDGAGTVLAENDDYRETPSGDSLPDPAILFEADTTGPAYVRLIADSDSRFNVYDLDATVLAGTETEPNGTGTSNAGTISSPALAEADVLVLDPGDAITGEIGASGDIDIFRVDVDATSYVVDLETAVNLEPDTVLVVFDSSGDVVVQNDDYDQQDSRAVFTLETGGTYYLAVTDYLSASQGSAGPYTLSIAEMITVD